MSEKSCLADDEARACGIVFDGEISVRLLAGARCRVRGAMVTLLEGDGTNLNGLKNSGLNVANVACALEIFWEPLHPS